MRTSNRVSQFLSMFEPLARTARGGSIKKMWHIQKLDYYSALNKRRGQPCISGSVAGLADLRLSEMTVTEGQSLIPHTWGVEWWLPGVGGIIAQCVPSICSVRRPRFWSSPLQYHTWSDSSTLYTSKCVMHRANVKFKRGISFPKGISVEPCHKTFDFAKPSYLHLLNEDKIAVSFQGYLRTEWHNSRSVWRRAWDILKAQLMFVVIVFFFLIIINIILKTLVSTRAAKNWWSPITASLAQ